MRYKITGKLTWREGMVWNILKERYGKDNAITSGEIKKLTGVNRFQLASIVQTLRLVHNIPVCTNKWGDNKGYFLPVKSSDIHATMGELESQASKLLDVVTVLYTASKELDNHRM